MHPTGASCGVGPGRGEDLPVLFLVHFSWHVCSTLWAAGLGVPPSDGARKENRGSLLLNTEGSFTHAGPTAWTLALNRFGRAVTSKKKKPASEWKPNCGKWIHFQPLTLPSPLPTSSAKPAASVIDLIHSWFSQSLGGHLVLVCSHYRTWEFIWRVGRWYVVWFERYTPWRLPSC